MTALMGLAFGVAGFAFAVVPAPDLKPPQALTVRLYDTVALPPSTIAGMRAAADEAVATAGITLQWLSCTNETSGSAACGRPRTDGDIIVRLLAEHDVATVARCGYSVSTEGVRGFISLSHACAAGAAAALRRGSTTARPEPPDEAQILGYMLAHEIAHVLLPGVPHSYHGLFKARLARRDWHRLRDGRLSFSLSDARRLHAAASTVHRPVSQ